MGRGDLQRGEQTYIERNRDRERKDLTERKIQNIETNIQIEKENEILKKR